MAGRPRYVDALIGLLAVLAVVGGLCACSREGSAGNGRADESALVLENKGSDTLVNLALAWAEAYMAARPQVRISVTGGGSGTGIAAMINGTVDIANASRAMKDVEKEAARENGYEPVELTVARDAIAVVVHPDNSVDQLSLQQISDMYTRKVTNWRDVGGGDKQSDLLFSPDTLLMPSSEGISTEIRQNVNAIGYDGLGYVTDDQKMVAVATDPDGPFVLPSVASVNDGSYPIARPLYMYTPGEPSGEMAEYLEWVTTEGQSLVSELGFVPLTP